MINNGFYIGASAGAMLATTSICFAEDFDKNFVGISDLKGLDLLPSTFGKNTLIPHYNKEEFLRWKKNTSIEKLDQFDYIDYITDMGYKLF